MEGRGVLLCDFGGRDWLHGGVAGQPRLHCIVDFEEVTVNGRSGCALPDVVDGWRTIGAGDFFKASDYVRGEFACHATEGEAFRVIDYCSTGCGDRDDAEEAG